MIKNPWGDEIEHKLQFYKLFQIKQKLTKRRRGTKSKKDKTEGLY